MESNDNKNKINSNISEEIDILKIIAHILLQRRIIIKSTIILAFIGLTIAIFTPSEYSAYTLLVPQIGEKKVNGSISGLAAIAGINVGSLTSGEVLSPKIYPKIFDNIDFQRELIYSKLKTGNAEEPISYYEIETNDKYKSFSITSTIYKYTIGLPSNIIGSLKSFSSDLDSIQTSKKSIISQLTDKEKNVIKTLFENLNLSINDKDGYISITFVNSDPILAAELVYNCQHLLQKYITNFKIEKVKRNLDFIEMSYNEAQVNFEKKQSELAKFRDANKNISSALARTQEEKLISEYELLLSVYNEIAKQKEQAKIAINETTPLLTTIVPVTIPTEKSGPKRTIILIGSIFIGMLIGIVYALSKPFTSYLKEIFKENISQKNI